METRASQPAAKRALIIGGTGVGPFQIWLSGWSIAHFDLTRAHIELSPVRAAHMTEIQWLRLWSHDCAMSQFPDDGNRRDVEHRRQFRYLLGNSGGAQVGLHRGSRRFIRRGQRTTQLIGKPAGRTQSSTPNAEGESNHRSPLFARHNAEPLSPLRRRALRPAHAAHGGSAKCALGPSRRRINLSTIASYAIDRSAENPK
jgi:hypothetical protein